MECRDIYRYLCAYLDGELDSERAVLVEEHLKICRTCRKELELQQIVKSLVREEFLSITAPDCLKERVMIELDRSEEYRESGVPVLDLIRWGTHSAQLYNTKSDLAEVLVPYIGRGLEQNELCVWVTSEMSEKEAREAITEEVSSPMKTGIYREGISTADASWILVVRNARKLYPMAIQDLESQETFPGWIHQIGIPSWNMKIL